MRTARRDHATCKKPNDLEDPKSTAAESLLQPAATHQIPNVQPPSTRHVPSKRGLRGIFAWPSSTLQVPIEDDDVPPTPAKPRRKPSRLAGRSAKKTSPSPMTKAKSSTSWTPTRTSPSFDPLPYFQALPQALKHAQLSASTMSADAILRLSNHLKPSDLQDDVVLLATGAEDDRTTVAASRSEKTRKKHRRHVSGSISRAEWTQKIFVLTTSGTLLQYTVEGSFDRLPEKMLQLGKDSVAFASDAIHGKHWVLQISHRIEPDGTPTDSRSFLSRLSLRNADYKRLATSFLLVLESAEEMDAWIATVRREIEALGGKKATSETGKPKVDNRVIQLSAHPSHRYLVKRDSSQTLRQNPQPSPTIYGPLSPLSVMARFEDGDKGSILSRPLSSARPSTGHRSISNSTTSYDGQQLDNLRYGLNRLSYMSTASPTRNSVSTIDDFSIKSMEEDKSLWKYNDRRQSMQPRILETEITQQSLRPHSIYGLASHPFRSISPATPNFSMPISSNKRYSTAKSMGLGPPPDHALPSIPSIRKSITRPPPLSPNFIRPTNNPVTQSRPPLVFTTTEGSFPRSPLSPRSPSQVPPRRVSSLMPLKDLEQVQNRTQLQRHSSLENIRSDKVELKKPRFKPAPLPPILTTCVTAKSQTIHKPTQIEPVAASEPYTLQALQDEQGTLQVARMSKRPMSLDTISSQIPRDEPRGPRSSTSGSTPPGISSRGWTFQNLSKAQAKHSAIASAVHVSSLSRTPSQRLKLSGHRISVPSLSGPPLAPPPECALPPIPQSIGIKSLDGLRPFVSVL